MSDEFNVDNRTFKDGHDPIWTALDKSDDDSSSAGGGSLQFYNSSNVETLNGSLVIRTTLGKTEWNRYNHIKKKWTNEVTYYKSGMMQSWDKFCFTGGIVEVDVTFPGNPYIGGLWPAIWMLGNLGRATYEASTNNIWPWSYNICNRKMQDRQAISACNAQNHFGMHPYQGRGATEIDIIEIMTGDSDGFFDATNPPVGLPYGDFTLQVSGALFLGCMLCYPFS
jgi:beta-glucanase (GH16 family)